MAKYHATLIEINQNLNYYYKKKASYYGTKSKNTLYRRQFRHTRTY